jgi:hypothetical protein
MPSDFDLVENGEQLFKIVGSRAAKVQLKLCSSALIVFDNHFKGFLTDFQHVQIVWQSAHV